MLNFDIADGHRPPLQFTRPERVHDLYSQNPRPARHARHFYTFLHYANTCFGVTFAPLESVSRFRFMKAARRFVVHNRTRGATLADKVQLADTPRLRRIGLLRHQTLEPGEGLWIYPTRAIHTFGM